MTMLSSSSGAAPAADSLVSIPRYDGSGAPGCDAPADTGHFDPHPLTEAWCRMLLNHKRKIAAFWIVLTLVSIAAAINVVGQTTVDVQAPEDTPSKVAKGKLAETFPHESPSTTYVVLIKREDGKPIDLDAGTHAGGLDDIVSRFRDAVYSWRGIQGTPAPPDFIQMFGDYYGYMEQGLERLAALDVSDDETAVIISISVHARVSDELNRGFSEYLEDAVEQFPLAQHELSAPPYYKGQIIGAPSFEAEAHRTQYLDITELVTSVSPITLLLMAFLLRSLRLITIAVVSVFVTSLVSFGIMFVITCGLPVATFTPVFLLAVCLGTTTTYTLILLHRYREVLLHARRTAQRPDTITATAQAVVGVGTTIAVSGLTLATTFFALCIYPVANIRSFAIACGSAVLTVVLCTVTLVPLILLVFRGFMDCIKPNPWWDAWDLFWERATFRNFKAKVAACFRPSERSAAGAGEDATDRVLQTNLETHLVDDGYDSDWNDSFRDQVPTCKTPAKAKQQTAEHASDAASDSLINQADGIDETSSWYRIGKFVTRFPWNIVVIVVIVAVSMPADLKATRFEVTADAMSMVPQDSAVLRGYIDLGDLFRCGEVYPFYVVMNATNGAPNITSSESWLATADLLHRMAHAVNDTEAGLHMINLFDSASITRGNQGAVNDYDLMQACVAGVSADPKCPVLKHASQFLSADGRSMWARITTPFAPMTSVGLSWLRASRKLRYPGLFEVYIAGEPAEDFDSMLQGVDRVPAMLATAFCGVFFLNLLRAKSLLIAVRALCTRAITLAFAYGLAEIAYGEGLFQWLDSHLVSEAREISYVVALTALPILAGMGLGPDFFLTMRIIETRRLPFAGADVDLTRRAIVVGLSRSGYVILTAGEMMLTCFLALLIFSRTTVHHQLAWYISVGVAFETFIVGPFFIPASTAVFGQLHPDLNWWPLALRPWREVLRGLPCTGSRPPPLLAAGAGGAESPRSPRLSPRMSPGSPVW